MNLNTDMDFVLMHRYLNIKLPLSTACVPSELDQPSQITHLRMARSFKSLYPPPTLP